MPKATKSTKTKPHVYLFSDVNVAPPKDGSAPRQFSGVANSGKPFNYYGVRVIVDLENLSFSDKVPALVEHERSKRAGFGVLSVENNQLMINGTLLDNDFGNEVADDADAGFPWQMSAHVIAETEENLTGNSTAIINGQTVTASITILRNCRIPEVSFTPTGVDFETSAVILGDDGKTQLSTPQKDNTMTLEEALAEIEKHKAAQVEKDNRIKELEDENAKLKASEAQANVDAQLSQAGFSKSEDGKWQGVSDTTYQVLLSQDADKARAMIGDLKLSQPNRQDAPGYLFGEQHKPNGNGINQGGNQFSNSLVENAKARASGKQTFI